VKITMKVAFVITLLGMVACSQSGKEDETNADDVKSELNDVVDVSKDYAAEKADDLNTEMKEMNESLSMKLVNIRGKYDAQSDKLKTKYKRQKAEMEVLKMKLDHKIVEYNEAVQEEQAALKKDIHKLEHSLEESIDTFEKQMAEKNNEKEDD
jgi:hypothetical protein